MKKNTLIYLMLYLMTFSAHAQYTIRGTVIDESQKGLLGATIRLFDADSVFVRGGELAIV